MDNYIVAVDLGGTQIRAALCTPAGEILTREQTLTLAQEGVQAVLKRIKETMRRATGDSWEQITAIGITSPGPLDPWAGVVLEAPNLPGWENVPLRDIIAQEFHRPTYVGNDANLAALAEQRFGAGRGVRDLIYLTISTGVGGGIIINDRLLLGSKGIGGEPGHMVLEPNGPRCNCGGRGCLETLASGTAIARRAREAALSGEATAILELVDGDPERITAREVNLAAQAGDPLAQRIFEEAGFYLGLGIVNLLHLFNPALIILGGSVTKAGDLLLEPVRRTVRQRTMSSRYWEDTPIVLAALGDDVGLLGGVALVLSKE